MVEPIALVVDSHPRCRLPIAWPETGCNAPANAMDQPYVDPSLDLEEEIARLKKERNAVILAHYYQGEPPARMTGFAQQ